MLRPPYPPTYTLPTYFLQTSFLHTLRVCLSRCLCLLNIGGTGKSIAITQSEKMCTYILLHFKSNKRVNFDIHKVSKIKSDNEEGNGKKIEPISLLIYNIIYYIIIIICELCNVIIQPINKIVLALFKIHPMPFLSHVANMLYNVRTLENNLPCYYIIDLYPTSIHSHVGLFRKYVKVGIHRAGIYLENIHLLKNVFWEKYMFQNKLKMYTFLVLITYYYTLNLDEIAQNKLYTLYYIHISNIIHSNRHILIIYIFKMLEFFMYNIVLYDELYSYIMIYTNVFFIVYWCTYMYMHLYLEQYFYTSSMKHSLYLHKGNVQGGMVFYFVHPWVYQYYFDFG